MVAAFNAPLKSVGFTKNAMWALKTATTMFTFFDVKSAQMTRTASHLNSSEEPNFDEFSQIFLKK